MKPVARTISTSGGHTAVEVETPPTDDGDALLRTLGVPRPQATLIVNGSTAPDELAGDGVAEAMATVAAVAMAEHLTVVTGATDAGIFSMLGSVLSAPTAPVIGVAPLALVTWAGRGGEAPDQEQLEAHHSHFVLVEGSQWGDETSTMMALAATLGRSGPSAALLCGGGAVARHEVLGHVRAGRPIVVLAGSGRLADELAAALAGAAADESLAEVIEQGDLVVCPLADGPEALAATLRRLLAGPEG